MSRQFVINGESLVQADGAELGLSDGPISLSFTFAHQDIKVDAWGGQIPPEIQFMLAEVRISMTLVYFDPSVLATAVRKSCGGAPAEGTMPRAGNLMGGGNNFTVLRITSPVQAQPWRFPTAYLMNSPSNYPLGTEKSLVQMTWRAIPYPANGDPYGGGNGALGTILWDHS